MENAKTFFHVLWMAFVVGVLVGSLLTGDVGAQSMVKGSREPHCEAESAGGGLFMSRTGRCYHVNQSCQNKDNNMVALKVGQVCLKQYERKNGWQKTR